MSFDGVVSVLGAFHTIYRYQYKGREPFFHVRPLVPRRPKRAQRNVLQ